MAGLDRQDKNFWRYIKGYDFIGLNVTWINKKRWEEIRNWLPETHIWHCKYAKKEKERRRAKGGIMLGMRKNLREEESEFIETGLDEIEHVRIKEAEGNLNIIVVYNEENGKEKEIGETIKKIIEICGGERIIVGGDFNIKTRELGGDEEEGRTTKKVEIKE